MDTRSATAAAIVYCFVIGQLASILSVNPWRDGALRHRLTARDRLITDVFQQSHHRVLASVGMPRRNRTEPDEPRMETSRPPGTSRPAVSRHQPGGPLDRVGSTASLERAAIESAPSLFVRHRLVIFDIVFVRMAGRGTERRITSSGHIYEVYIRAKCRRAPTGVAFCRR